MKFDEIKEDADQRKQNALWAQITAHEKAAKQSKDLKRDHHLKMADQLRSKLKTRDDVAEEKVRLDPKCWTGKKIGNPKTKIKGGVRVNNCVPAESVAEGASDTIYPGAEVIKTKRGKPVGEIYQDASGWGCHHYDADLGADCIESREEAIEWLKDLHDEHRQDKGLREGNFTKTPSGDHVNMHTGVRSSAAPAQKKVKGYKWEVHFDYGPHMSDSVVVTATSENEARAKAEKAAQKAGRSIMINWAKPAEQGVEENRGYFDGMPTSDNDYFRIPGPDAKHPPYVSPARPEPQPTKPAKYSVGAIVPVYMGSAPGVATINPAQIVKGEILEVDPSGHMYVYKIKLQDGKIAHVGDKRISVARSALKKSGVAEEYNPEYDDEAGMAQGSLHTMKNAVEGLQDIIDSGDNLPEWCQEKLSLAEDYLVTVWDYIQSEKAQGMDPEMQELAEEFDMIERIIESIAAQNGVDAEAVWSDLESLTEDELYAFAVTSQLNEDWQKANKRDKTDGMSSKAVKAYRREHPGSKLQTAVTTKPSKLKKGSKASKRRKSYCSRSRGQMKMHNISCAKTPDKAICKARRRWNC